jgi:hypothetical protein
MGLAGGILSAARVELALAIWVPTPVSDRLGLAMLPLQYALIKLTTARVGHDKDLLVAIGAVPSFVRGICFLHRAPGQLVCHVHGFCQRVRKHHHTAFWMIVRAALFYVFPNKYLHDSFQKQPPRAHPRSTSPTHVSGVSQNTRASALVAVLFTLLHSLPGRGRWRGACQSWRRPWHP